ncbi:hypothetical protein PS655_04149 [Pseudomonas fluorescens]|uniref:Uncharacterized protein n=1 Tax=Pseudomonas fluorescens TaxID=294 RepID=A0A5E6VG67_PSEFL|nr:hypothetical protein PS655_04149 [Pseudomonas fluorescens]
MVLANYIDLRLRGDLGFAKPEITMFVQVDRVQIGNSVGSLSFWERARVRVAFYPQSLLADLWITCSPLSRPQANQALQPSDQKTTSLSHGFSGVFRQDNAASCPQTLLALLWIRCSLSADTLIKRGLQRIDQKTINSSIPTANFCKNPDFTQPPTLFHRQGKVTPELCWRFCG